MEVGVYEADVGHPMMNEPDLVPGHAIDFVQDVRGLAAHHNERIGELCDIGERLLVSFVRLPQHGMKGGDDRSFQISQEMVDVGAFRPPEYAELVLQADHPLTRHVDVVGRKAVVVDLILRNLEGDLLRVIAVLDGVVHGHNVECGLPYLSPDRVRKVVGERGDAAVSRRVGCDEVYLDARVCMYGG